MELRIKIIIRERESQSSQILLDVLQRATTAVAVTAVNRTARIKKEYAAKHSAVVETLQSSTTKNYLQDTCEDPQEFFLISNTSKYQGICRKRSSVLRLDVKFSGHQDQTW